MSRSCLCRVVPWLGSIGLMALGAGPTQAQDVGSYGPSLSSARMSSSSFSGAGSYFGGSSTYVPFGGAMGGFVPYSSGPGGGLGVQPEESVTLVFNCHLAGCGCWGQHPALA